MSIDPPPRGLKEAGEAADALEQARLHGSLRARLFGDGHAPLLAGRYEIGARLGSGGMGVVYRARDRELDRDVAVKVVRGHADPTASTHAARFIAEARSLARLAHPNVVAIYDVGPMDDGIFLAMELCPGLDLRRWIAAAPRRWSEVLAVLVQAGRGLAAAHAVGVVHRDVKPSNILVGSDRVRLLDFGLSKAFGAGRPALASVSELGTDDDARKDGSGSATLDSRGNGISGTPPYMAPEQHEGGRVDERSDQYGFCVAAFEVLFGRRPFPETTIHALVAAKLAAAIASRPAGSRVPRAIHRALARGLLPDPAARWPSMADLLDALERAARARPRALAGLAGLAIVVSAIMLPLQLTRAPPPCTGAAAQLAGVWDDDRRTAVRESLRATDAPYSAAAWSRIEPELDDYAQAWMRRHTEVCIATSISGEQPPAILDARMACLQRARRGLQSVVDVLARADATIVQRAADLTGSLQPLDRCDDVDASGSATNVPTDLAIAAEVDRIRASIAHAAALRGAGKFADAISLLEPELARARASAFVPVQAEVLYELGTAHGRTNDLVRSEAELREAKTLASDAGMADLAARAAAGLIYLVGYKRARPDEALALRDEVLALARGLPTGIEIAASAHTNLGSALQVARRYDAAEAEHRKSLELYAQVFGAEHPQLAVARNNLANSLEGAGKFADAEAEHRVALAQRERSLGPDHPDVAMSRNNLANALAHQRRYVEAEGELRLALAIRLRAFGPDSADVATTRNNLGNVLGGQGHHAEEIAEHRAALTSFERALGSDHPRTVWARYSIANALVLMGRSDEAERELEALIARYSATLGRDHTIIAAAHAALGKLRTAHSRPEGREDN